MAPKVKTICVDFDGVIAKYIGWVGPTTFGAPLHGCKEALMKLKDMGWIVIIHTTRIAELEIGGYLTQHGIPFDYINHNPENFTQRCNDKKPLANVYLDDRGMEFNGDWGNVVDRVKDFEPWHKR